RTRHPLVAVAARVLRPHVLVHFQLRRDVFENPGDLLADPVLRAAAADGGGVDNKRDSQLTITGSTISKNSASDSGGGLGDSETEGFGPGLLTIVNTTVSNNTAVNNGGGIDVEGTDLVVMASTVSGNQAATGGGIANGNGATALLENATIAGNVATNQGGGLEALDDSSALLVNVTIAYNGAQSGGGIDVAPEDSLVVLGNTLVAKNSATTNPDVQGTFGSDGNNLIGNVGTATGFVGSDLVGTSLSPINPHIGPLANNGGPTKTIALLSGSPAINAGSSSLALEFGITTDQRGEPRFAPGGDSMVDIGAYEVDSVFASVATDGVDES
ncbi:MAG TPA: choice-of-anchor Q domain-containing protein, partial [Planctomycetaceae bacterium]|nr:choice-of-anchor Q domain-containing protein [Planctomycetaceae bacterium]